MASTTASTPCVTPSGGPPQGRQTHEHRNPAGVDGTQEERNNPQIYPPGADKPPQGDGGDSVIAPGKDRRPSSHNICQVCILKLAIFDYRPASGSCSRVFSDIDVLQFRREPPGADTKNPTEACWASPGGVHDVNQRGAAGSFEPLATVVG